MPNEEHDAQPWQASGKGLWIGGLGFADKDIATVTVETDRYTDQWVLQLVFTQEGNRKFIEAQRCGVSRVIEISFDRKPVSRPLLQEPILGGTATISGGWQSREEAEQLAARIRAP